MLQRFTPGVDLHLYRFFNLVAIAARHGHDQGHTALLGPIEHTTVPRLKALITELQAA
jgi:hypothetical protein